MSLTNQNLLEKVLLAKGNITNGLTSQRPKLEAQKFPIFSGLNA